MKNPIQAIARMGFCLEKLGMKLIVHRVDGGKYTENGKKVLKYDT